MPLLRRATVVVALLPLLAGLAACTGQDAEQLPELPALGRAWEAPGVTVGATITSQAPDAVWLVDGVLVTVAAPTRDDPTTVVTGLDAGTGRERWTQALTGRYCAGSEGTDSAGHLALLLGNDAGDCSSVTLLDTADGSTVWTRRRPVRRGDPVAPRVGVGDSMVTVSGRCGSVLAYRTADGRPQPPLGTPARSLFCDAPGGVADGVAAYVERDAPRGPARLVVRSTDDGSVSSDRPTTAALVNGVVSTDPLVLDVGSGPGRAVRRYDATGSPGPYVGLRPDVSTLDVAARVDGVVVGTYEDSGMLHAYDATTGEELWQHWAERFSGTRRLAGVHDGRLVWTQEVDTEEGDAGYPEHQVWVTESDPRDPGSGRTLGTVGAGLGGSDLFVVRGDLLLQPGGTSLRATTLDTEGEPGVQEAPASRRYDVRDIPWGDGDVRDDEADGACRAVSAATLRELDLPADLPPPVGCRWYATPGEAGRRDLDVSVTADQPGQDTTGADAAADHLERDFADQSGAREVAGLGDQAYLVGDQLGTTTSPSGFAEPVLGSTTRLGVRRGNVVVEVSTSATGGARGRTPGPDTLERAAVDAAADVLDSLGLGLGSVPAGGPAPVVTAAPDACRAAGAAGRDLVGGAPRAQPTTDDETLSACTWRDGYDAQLVVVARAVPTGPADGRSGTERAAALVAAAPGEGLRGVGEEARLEQDYDYTSTLTLTARRDNLVVQLHLARDDDDDVLDDRLRLVRLARTLLAPR